MIKVYIWCLILGNIFMIPIIDSYIRTLNKKTKIPNPMWKYMYTVVLFGNFIISPIFIMTALRVNISIIYIMITKRLVYTKALDYFFENYPSKKNKNDTENKGE